MKLKYLLPLCAGAVLMAGCAADRATESSDVGGAAPQAPAAERGQPGEGPQAKPPGEGVTVTSAPVDGRSLIYRADITVKVDDVQKSADELAALIRTAGGFVSSEKRVAHGKFAQASVMVRVPSKEYAATMEKIAGLGDEQNRNSNVEDVTEAIVDLDTRIAAQRASVESVRRMFERAGTLQDVVLLEKELSQRQAELASLEGKKRRLDDLVALSTITVTLAGPNVDIEVEEEPDPSFLGGLKSGWDAFVGAVKIGSAVLGFLLPFLLAIAVPVVALVAFLRYRRRQPAAVTQEPAQEQSHG